MRNGSEVYSRRHRRDNLLQEKYRNNNGSEELGQGDDGTVRKKGTKGNQRTTTCEDEEFANVSTWYLVVIAVVRLLACVGWGWGILYATYHVYMAAESNSNMHIFLYNMIINVTYKFIAFDNRASPVST